MPNFGTLDSVSRRQERGYKKKAEEEDILRKSGWTGLSWFALAPRCGRATGIKTQKPARGAFHVVKYLRPGKTIYERWNNIGTTYH